MKTQWVLHYKSTEELTNMFIIKRICFSECSAAVTKPLQWRHDGRNGVSNHQPHECLLHRLIRRRSKKTSKLHVTGLYAGNSPETDEFPAKMASNAGNVSIWWRHHFVPEQFVCLPEQLRWFVWCVAWPSVATPLSWMMYPAHFGMKIDLISFPEQ